MQIGAIVALSHSSEVVALYCVHESCQSFVEGASSWEHQHFGDCDFPRPVRLVLQTGNLQNVYHFNEAEMQVFSCTNFQ